MTSFSLHAFLLNTPRLLLLHEPLQLLQSTMFHQQPLTMDPQKQQQQQCHHRLPEQHRQTRPQEQQQEQQEEQQKERQEEEKQQQLGVSSPQQLPLVSQPQRLTQKQQQQERRWASPQQLLQPCEEARMLGGRLKSSSSSKRAEGLTLRRWWRQLCFLVVSASWLTSAASAAEETAATVLPGLPVAFTTDDEIAHIAADPQQPLPYPFDAAACSTRALRLLQQQLQRETPQEQQQQKSAATKGMRAALRSGLVIENLQRHIEMSRAVKCTLRFFLRNTGTHAVRRLIFLFPFYEAVQLGWIVASQEGAQLRIDYLSPRPSIRDYEAATAAAAAAAAGEGFTAAAAALAGGFEQLTAAAAAEAPLATAAAAATPGLLLVEDVEERLRQAGLPLQQQQQQQARAATAAEKRRRNEGGTREGGDTAAEDGRQKAESEATAAGAGTKGGAGTAAGAAAEAAAGAGAAAGAAAAMEKLFGCDPFVVAVRLRQKLKPGATAVVDLVYYLGRPYRPLPRSVAFEQLQSVLFGISKTPFSFYEISSNFLRIVLYPRTSLGDVGSAKMTREHQLIPKVSPEGVTEWSRESHRPLLPLAGGFDFVVLHTPLPLHLGYFFSAERRVEVSHLGDIVIREKYRLHNDAAALKGGYNPIAAAVLQGVQPGTPRVLRQRLQQLQHRKQQMPRRPQQQQQGEEAKKRKQQKQPQGEGAKKRQQQKQQTEKGQQQEEQQEEEETQDESSLPPYPASHLLYSLAAVLPARVQQLHFFDKIGNVSSSYAHRVSLAADDLAQDPSPHTYTHLEVYPRFPLVGGWNTDFQLQYNVPADAAVYVHPNDSSRFTLHVTVTPPFREIYTEDLLFSVVLPTGAKEIEVNFLPRAAESSGRGNVKTWLDYSSTRVLLQFYFRSWFVPDSKLLQQKLQIHYTHSPYLLPELGKQLQLALLIFLIFLFYILCRRLRLRIVSEKEIAAVELIKCSKAKRRRLLKLFEDFVHSSEDFLEETRALRRRFAHSKPHAETATAAGPAAAAEDELKKEFQRLEQQWQQTASQTRAAMRRAAVEYGPPSQQQQQQQQQQQKEKAGTAEQQEQEEREKNVTEQLPQNSTPNNQPQHHSSEEPHEEEEEMQQQQHSAEEEEEKQQQQRQHQKQQQEEQEEERDTGVGEDGEEVLQAFDRLQMAVDSLAQQIVAAAAPVSQTHSGERRSALPLRLAQAKADFAAHAVLCAIEKRPIAAEIRDFDREERSGKEKKKKYE